MADFFFFTQLDSPQNQSQDQAFGPDPIDPLKYRVDNQFFVAADAPAIAVAEGIPLVQQCDSDPNCVNIVLYPIKNPDFNFPNIKLFIYRGIRKDAILNTNGEVLQSDTSWKSNNLLTVIHELQNKINQDAGTSEIPKAENLGYHYSDPTDTDNFQTSSEFIETVIFLNDGLQLPLVKAGCQLGKFIGGGGSGTPAGFQIVLDRVGYEPTLALARKNDDVVTVSNLATNPTEVQTFQHWHEKEQILTYLDPAAFYGCSKANGLKVKTYQNNADTSGSRVDAASIVALHHNKNCCYIDIRNDYNYSFNYYNNFRKTIELGFQQDGTQDLLINSIDYYTDWPLLRIVGQTVPTANPESQVRLRLPINDVATYNARYFLRSYTHKFLEKAESTLFQELNYLDASGAIRKDFCEAIFIKSWVSSDDVLGANYFSFKYGKVQISELSDDIISRRNQYDLVFPVEMKNLIGDDILDDGDFKVSLYSSENAPIVLKNFLDISNEYYTQYIGIAKDKYNTTFFSFPDRIGYESGRRLKFPFAIVQEGKYDNSAFLEEFQYTQGTDSLGFLEVLPKRTLDSALVLKKVAKQLNGQLEEFLYYLNSAPSQDNKFSIDARKFHAITVSNEEYDTILTLKGSDFDPGYRVFLDVNNETLLSQNHDGFAIGRSDLKLQGIEFNTTDDRVQAKEVVVEDTTNQEKSELNFYVNKT